MTLRIASGTTDQYLHFSAPPTLGNSPATWTVYRSRNGGTATIMTTPTIIEVDSTNMPGLYALLLDEDMTVTGNNVTEHMSFYISETGWSGALFEIELYNPTQYSVNLTTDAINSASVAASGATEIAQATWAEVLGNSGYSASAIVQIMAGAIAGKISGAGTSTITIRSIEDDANIIVATVDASGNRSLVTITTPGD